MDALRSHEQATRLDASQQRMRRVTGRLLELMLDRAEEGSDPNLTRDVVFERLNEVKDDLPAAQAALDAEMEFHAGPIHDQWGWGGRA